MIGRLLHIVGLSLTLTLGVGSALADSGASGPPAAIARHVVIIGVDGLGADALERLPTPHIDRLAAQGASAATARAVLPTLSKPNWASMFTGAPPAEHGVVDNEWSPTDTRHPPTFAAGDGRFPNLFHALAAQRPQDGVACFLEWADFAQLVPPGSTRVQTPGAAPATAAAAARWFREHRPTFLFVHLDLVDHAGHTFGHGGWMHASSVILADKLVGAVLAAVDEPRTRDHTVVILTSDHGGVGKGHGGDSPAEVNIPWIIRGPGIPAGQRLKRPVEVFDTAPTAAWALGLERPTVWKGRVVREAFTPR